MKKIDATVKRETLYIGLWTLVMSVFMEAVFLVIQKWDYTVLLGNLLGFAASVLNFFLLGLTVQSVLGKEEKEAKNALKLSQGLRLLMMLVVAVLAAVLPVFHLWATVIPFFFPRVAIMLRPLFFKKDPEVTDKNE